MKGRVKKTHSYRDESKEIGHVQYTKNKEGKTKLKALTKIRPSMKHSKSDLSLANKHMKEHMH